MSTTVMFLCTQTFCISTNLCHIIIFLINYPYLNFVLIMFYLFSALITQFHLFFFVYICVGLLMFP